MEMINRRLPNIIIPLNIESEEMLFRNINDERGLYYVLPISREDLSTLQQQDFFEEINKRFNLNIDEYEEEYLNATIQKKVLIYLKYEYSSNDFMCEYYRNKLILFINLSLKMNRSIFFLL